MSFDKFALSKKILDAVKDCNYTTPTPIQENIIPFILKGKDVQAVAPTGSGKTAAFVLPIIEELSKNSDDSFRLPRALILVPTRELAVQIDENIKKYAKNTDLKSLTIFGGTKLEPQRNKLQKSLDIIVATPGRLVDHIKDKSIDLGHLEMLVLDEADTMLDMGFINEINQVFESLHSKVQMMLFSATMGERVKELAERLLDAPHGVNIDKKQKATHKIEQFVYYISKEEKNELVSYLIGKNYLKQYIVFTRTKQSAEEVYEFLKEAGLRCDSLHGDKTHGNRQKAIKKFRDGDIQVLVATDITARGIDINGLEYIINYDIPNAVDDYIHRIGRTGRAGMDGNAISLVSSSEVYSLKVIERKLQLKVKELKEDGFGIKDEDREKSPKIIIKKEQKRKVKGAFGNQKKKMNKEPKKKKLRGKRSGWNIKDSRE
jgi:ATP-dependent RNA helicase RhlE